VRHLCVAVLSGELADRLAVPVQAQPGQPAQDRRRRRAFGCRLDTRQFRACCTGQQRMRDPTVEGKRQPNPALS